VPPVNDPRSSPASSAAGAAPLRIALVGYGYWGPNLLRNYMELPGAQVAWVCDRRPEALATAQSRYPAIAATTDLEVVLKDAAVDAVLVATPISTHHAIAKAALETGKHVFVEKPMTADAAQARELVELAAERGLTLMVGHTFVYSPPVSKVKELIDQDVLGEIYFITTQRVNLGLHQQDASVVWDLAPHDLSILYYWLGEAAGSVAVTGRGCIVPSIPDVAFINLKFPSGVVAEIQASWLSPVKLRRTIVVGSKKMLLYDDTENVEKVKVFDHGVQLTEPHGFGEFQLSYRTGDIVSPKIEHSEPLKLEAQEFLGAIAERRQPLSDGASGLQVVASLESAEYSLRHDGCEQVIAAAAPS